MSSTLDRLRRLHSLRSSRQNRDIDSGGPTQSAPQTAENQVFRSSRLEEAAPGREIENDGGVCYLSTHSLPGDEARGDKQLSALLACDPTSFASLFPAFALDQSHDFSKAAFIDTETTGLGGGAGVYSFMVGVGVFKPIRVESASVRPMPSTDPDDVAGWRFVVHQFFMRNPAEEPALLTALSSLMQDCELVVTFNGRSFDLPLLRTRYRQNRPFLAEQAQMPRLLGENQPHLDLLHPARRLWRRRLQSCRLINLEQQILHQVRSEEDVPGHLIPLLYTQFVQSGNAREMGRVFYHNQEDIVTMAALAERLATVLSRAPDDEPQGELHGLEWLALGLCYEKMGQPEHAEPAYRRAVEQLRRPRDQREAFLRLGDLLKRQRQWQAAADAWQLWLTTVPGPDPAPYVELAKYHEWQVKDLEQAEVWAGWALHNLRTGSGADKWSVQVAELEHRLARIQRKRAGKSVE